MSVKAIPEGFHTVTPYLVVSSVDKQIEFLKAAFGATVVFRHTRPDGAVMHAQVKIGDSMIMMGEPMGGYPAMPASFYLYVEDCDTLYKRAVEAGGVSICEPVNMFYGDRHGAVKDALGNCWSISTHIEDVSSEELTRRTEVFSKK